MSCACGLASTITQSTNNYPTMCVPLINRILPPWFWVGGVKLR